MASQQGGGGDITSLDVEFFVRGYNDIWDPQIGEVLPLVREPDKPEDKCTFAIARCGQYFPPFNLGPPVSAFLRRGCNKEAK